MGGAVARQSAALVNRHGLPPKLHGLAGHWSQEKADIKTGQQQGT